MVPLILLSLVLAVPPTLNPKPCLTSPPDGLACVPGGVFIRGSDTDTHICHQPTRPKMKKPDTHPAAKIWLETFYMDRFEVTNADYRACVKAKKCRRAGPRYRDFHAPDQPITGISWHDAVAYCKWRGKHLPTEAQWEKAARGPKGDLYPWGNEPVTCKRAVIRDRRGRSCGVRKRGSRPYTGKVLPVGSRPAGRYGIHDLIGNTGEWVYDWYSPSYADCGEACLGPDPKGPCDGKDPCPGHAQRIVRGGSWYWPAEHDNGIHRRPHFPSNSPFHHFGFRCAASHEEARKLSLPGR